MYVTLAGVLWSYGLVWDRFLLRPGLFWTQFFWAATQDSVLLGYDWLWADFCEATLQAPEGIGSVYSLVWDGIVLGYNGLWTERPQTAVEMKGY